MCNCPEVFYPAWNTWVDFCGVLPTLAAAQWEGDEPRTWRCRKCHGGIVRMFLECTRPRNASAVVDDDYELRQDPRETMSAILRRIRERGGHGATTEELMNDLPDVPAHAVGAAVAALRDGRGSGVDEVSEVRGIVRIGYRCRAVGCGWTGWVKWYEARTNPYCGCNGCPEVFAVFDDASEWGPYCNSLPDVESEGTWRCPWCQGGITRTGLDHIEDGTLVARYRCRAAAACGWIGEAGVGVWASEAEEGA